MTTVDRRLLPSTESAGRYSTLVAAPGEPHRVVGDGELSADWRERARPLLVLAQLSDLHVMDAESPARLELLDRYADLDSPWQPQLPSVGTYRPQEPFTAHVVEAMVSALNAQPTGPVSGAPVSLAVVTGDMTDNAQANELATYLALLDGGPVAPSSGDPARWEGIGGDREADERYWHSEGDAVDLPWVRGFPIVPGALGAAARPFVATGLRVPWLAVHGNHDLMIQGTVPPAGAFAGWATADRKMITGADDLDPVAAFTAFEDCDPVALDLLSRSITIPVTPDGARHHVTRAEHIAAHLASPGRPAGHGYDQRNRADGTTYYVWDTADVRCVMLDTVNEHGGWQGSLDRAQLAWLLDVLGSANDRPVVLFSHHPLETLINDRCPEGGPSRVLAAELRDVLLGYANVVAWINGHTHEHRITEVRRPDGSLAWWQITTGSHIDWPQQSRIIELLTVDEQLVIACTLVDSAGVLDWRGRDDPLALAGLSRELAANSWQRPAGGADDRAGLVTDRNVLLVGTSRRPADGESESNREQRNQQLLIGQGAVVSGQHRRQ